MAHSIFGFRTYTASLQSGVARHAAGLVRPENAIPRPGWPAAKNLLVDEPPGTGWPARLDFVDDGWSTGADLGAADVSPNEPGASPTRVVVGEDGTRTPEYPKRGRKSRGLSRIELQLLTADRAMREELAKPRRGKAPCRAVELLLAGPPPWDSLDAWPLERVLEWARASVEFVRSALPDATIAAASLHLDEHSPHMHVTLAPIVRERDQHGELTGKVKLGSRAVRAALAAHAPKRDARLKHSYRDELSRAAAAYAHEVGAKYSLEAGQVASTAKHVPVDPIEGARRRAEQYREAAAQASADLRTISAEATELRRESARRRGEREVAQRETAIAKTKLKRVRNELGEAREARERDEAIAGGRVTGMRSRRGQELVAEYKAAQADAERRRDEAERALKERTGELEDARRSVQRWQNEAKARETERDDERVRVSALERERDEAVDAREQANASLHDKETTLAEAMQKHPDEVQAAFKSGWNAGFNNGIGQILTVFSESAQRLGHALPGQLLELMQRCVDACVLGPLLDAGRPEEPEQAPAIAPETAQAPSPARPSRAGWGQGLG